MLKMNTRLDRSTLDAVQRVLDAAIEQGHDGDEPEDENARAYNRGHADGIGRARLIVEQLRGSQK